MRQTLAPFRRHYSEALARVTATVGVPFGYTLTIWSSAALADHFFGAPGVTEVVVFVSGAVAVYLAFGAVEYGSLRREEPLHTRRVVLFNGVPVVAALLVIVLDRLIDDPFWGWLASGGVATGTYIVLLAGVWAFGARAAERDAGRE